MHQAEGDGRRHATTHRHGRRASEAPDFQRGLRGASRHHAYQQRNGASDRQVERRLGGLHSQSCERTGVSGG